MKSYHGSIYLIEDGVPKFFEYAWLHTETDRSYIEVVSRTFENANWDLILGEFNDPDYRQITFVDCRTSGGYSSSPSGFKYTIWFDYGITGTHILSPEELSFKEACIYIPTLTKWLHHQEFVNQIKFDYENSKVDVPETQEVCKVKTDQGEISVSVTYPFTHGDEMFEIEKASIVNFKFDNLTPVKDILAQLSKFKKLVLFITNTAPDPSTISFKLEQNEKEQRYPIWGQLLGPSKELDESKFSVTPKLYFNEMRHQFDIVIKNWFEKEELMVVSDLILEKRYNVEMTWKSYFLNLCVALESFTDIVKPKNNFPELKDRVKKRKEISNLIEDEELKQWFKENTAYLKKPWAKDKILLYKDTIEYLMSNVFKENSEELITKIKKTRDLIAHTGKYDKEFSPLELLLAGKILEFTIRSEIIQIMFSKPDKIKKKFLLYGKNRIETIARLNKYNQ